MDKEILDMVIKIGNEVCEECGLDRDCGLKFNECSRITNASALINNYLKTPKRSGKEGA